MLPWYSRTHSILPTVANDTISFGKLKFGSFTPSTKAKSPSITYNTLLGAQEFDLVPKEQSANSEIWTHDGTQNTINVMQVYQVIRVNSMEVRKRSAEGHKAS